MKILHLYHDIMNLYGEYGNVSALTRMLEKNHIFYELDRLSVGDEPTFMDYDFIYVGSGTENNQKQILNHLLTCKEELKQYIEAGKLLLMTGNSFELLGHAITDAKGKEWQGLSLFPFTVKEQDRTRNTADAIFTMEGQEKELVGFINKCSTIEGITTPLFNVKMGLGNGNDDNNEGIRHKNFFGTHLTGPVLIKNPYFLIYLTELLGKNVKDHAKKHSDTEPQNTDQGQGSKLAISHLTHEIAGYEITLRELGKRLAG